MINNQSNNNQSNSSKKTGKLKDIILDYIKQEIEQVVKFHTQSEDEDSWNLEEIYEVMDTIFPVPLAVRVDLEEIKEEDIKTLKHENIKTEAGDHQISAISHQEIKNKTVREKLVDYLYNLAVKEYEKLENRINGDGSLRSQLGINQEPMRVIEKMLLLRSIDLLWVEHIDAMDHMRTSIGLRGYGQKDPLVEYKKEAHRMFQELLANIRKQAVYSVYKVGLVPAPQPTFGPDDRNLEMKGAAKTGEEIEKLRNKEIKGTNFSAPAKIGAISSTIKSVPLEKGGRKKVGRNEPCPCGSGKKYKKCHGK